MKTFHTRHHMYSMKPRVACQLIKNLGNTITSKKVVLNYQDILLTAGKRKSSVIFVYIYRLFTNMMWHNNRYSELGMKSFSSLFLPDSLLLRMWILS